MVLILPLTIRNSARLSNLKIIGWGGGVVAHEILASPRPLGFGFLGFGAKGLGPGLEN